MARKNGGGNGTLDEALRSVVQSLAILVQNQAAMQAQKADNDKRVADIEKENAETRRDIVATNRENAERFARIETLLLDHNRILTDHTSILQALKDAVREKIGFKTPSPS